MKVKVFEGDAHSLTSQINAWLDRSDVTLIDRQVCATGNKPSTGYIACFVLIWYEEKKA